MLAHNGYMKVLPILEPATDDAGRPPVQARGLAADEAKQQALVFKALADPNRLRLLSIVKSASSGATCVCDLTEPLDLSQPTVSHHLKVLVEAGLLHREKRGTWAYYSLVPGALESTAGLLATL